MSCLAEHQGECRSHDIHISIYQLSAASKPVYDHPGISVFLVHFDKIKIPKNKHSIKRGILELCILNNIYLICFLTSMWLML